MRIVIIGAGASGLMAAMNISSEHEVIILEKAKIGKKLLKTGAGKCNYWNSEINSTKYNSTNQELLGKIISKENQNNVLEIFTKIGIIPKIKNGYFYPSTESAYTMKDALYNQVKTKALIKEDFPVINIKKEKDKFIISSKDETIECDKLIIASGSNASLNEEDFTIYNFLKQYHTIIPILPALTSLKINDKTLLSLVGLRIDAEVSLYENEKLIKKELGQLQLTKTSLSGICIFNLSSLASRGLYNHKKEVISINFLSFLNTSNYLEYFNNRNLLMNKPPLKELFTTILNYKLVNNIFSKEKINDKEKWNDLSNEKKISLLKAFTSYEVQIISPSSIKESQTVTGGISLEEIDPKTCKSLLVDNLYLVGEILDVDGICGGFNLAFAFITGFLAGRSV